MASIRREVLIEARPEHVWAAVRDVGNIHKRLVPGFVTDSRLEGDTRIVTFGSGMVVREPMLDVNDDDRRVAWAAEGGQFKHYNASVQVFDEGADRSRIVWIADLLPNELATNVAEMIEQGLAVMKQTLEKH